MADHHIRCFLCSSPPPSSARSASYLEDHEDAVAFGRRLAWFLNGEGFCCGPYTALYICLCPALKPGIIQITDDGGDWWQRYAYVGVPEDFPNMPDASEIVKSGTVSTLKAIRPDLTSTIEYAEKMVRTHGDDLRFLMQTRKAKHHIIDLNFNIPVGKQPQYLFTSLTDLSSGAFLKHRPCPSDLTAHPSNITGRLR